MDHWLMSQPTDSASHTSPTGYTCGNRTDRLFDPQTDHALK
jgi:hypothetical protein